MLRRPLRSFAIALMSSVVVLNLFIISAKAANNSNAGQPNGFLVSPVRNELSVDKGQSKSVTIALQNPTSVSITAQPIVNDFIASSDESGTPKLILNNTPPFPVNDFRSLVGTIENISLKPGEKKYISILIHVPSDAGSGGYYGAIRFIPTGNTLVGNVGLTASVGTLFLVTVPGNLTEKLSVVELAAANSTGTPESIFFFGKVSVLTRLQNSGNVHTQPFGRVQVTNMRGHIVDKYEFNTVQGNILPNSIRKYIDPLSYKSWFGHYTITENLAWVQGSGNIINASVSFWYFPIWFVITLLALIALLVLWLIWRKKKKNKSRSLKS